jgi:hypothetical protein
VATQRRLGGAPVPHEAAECAGPLDEEQEEREAEEVLLRFCVRV